MKKRRFSRLPLIAAAKQKKGTAMRKKLRVFPQPLSNNGIFAVRRGQDGKETAPLSLMSSMPSEILLVEDELDVGLGVRQTLLLQGLPQLRGAAEEHPHFGSVGETHTITHSILDKHGCAETDGKAPHLGCCDAILENSLSQLGFP